MNPLIPSKAEFPRFRIRWRGYDCADVEAYIRDVAADRERLQQGLTRIDALIARHGSDAATAELAAARRQATDIRIAAEQEARRLLSEATEQAEFLQDERLQASRVELEHLKALRDSVARSLQTSVTALREAHQLLARDDRLADPKPLLREEAPPTMFASARPQERAWRRLGRRPLPAAVGLVASTGLVLLFAAQSGAPDQATPPAVPAPVVRAPVVQDSIAAPEPESEPVAPGSRELASAASASPSPAASQRRAPAPAPAGAESGLTLTLTARRTCWISTTLDGQNPMERLMAPSESIILRADEEVVVRIGDAGALSALINNQPARSFGADGQVATVRITRANYRNFLDSL